MFSGLSKCTFENIDLVHEEYDLSILEERVRDDRSPKQY